MKVYKNILFVFVVLLISNNHSFAGGIKKGYEALQQLDYFKAKKKFSKGLKYNYEAASFGLAIIFSRDDNPFHQKDSAYAYINMADTAWNHAKERKKLKWAKYGWTRSAIDSMKQVISKQFYDEAVSINSVDSYTTFLKQHPWSTNYNQVLQIRDSIAFHIVAEKNTAEAYKEFMNTYPESMYVTMAEDYYYNSHYYEKTADGSVNSFMKFIEEYPDSPMREEAEFKVYSLVTKPNTVEAYELFILGYEGNRNIERAWSEFFQVYLSNYSEERIQKFLEKYPSVPNKERIEQEMAWSEVVLLPYVEDDLYGFATIEGKKMIEAKYEFAGFFVDGLAQVVKDGKFGFVNKLGELQIPFMYESVTVFHEGRSVVELDGKLGMIDRNNKLLLKCIYNDLGDVSNQRIYISTDEKYGYADWNGALVVPETFDEAYGFVNGVARVEKDGKVGIVNQSGAFVIPMEYEDLAIVSDTMLMCSLNGRKGLVTYNGTPVIEPIYDQIGSFKDGLALVSKGDTIEYINVNGEVVISDNYAVYPNFLLKGEFNEGAAIVYKDGKYGKVNTYGNVITNIKYENIGIGGKFAPFQKEEKWGLMNSASKVIISPLYESVDLFDDKYVIVRQGDSLGALDVIGNELFEIDYVSVDYLVEGLFAVNDGNKSGLYKEDELIAPIEYDRIEVLNDDFVILVKGSERQYYDIRHKKLIEIKRYSE